VDADVRHVKWTLPIFGSGQIHGGGHNISDSSDRGGRYCETTDRIGSYRLGNWAMSRINWASSSTNDILCVDMRLETDHFSAYQSSQ